MFSTATQKSLGTKEFYKEASIVVTEATLFVGFGVACGRESPVRFAIRAIGLC